MSNEQTSAEPPYDHQKWVHELGREDAHRAHDQNSQFTDKLNEATVKSGDAALRAALLINGGAAVSVLAFIGGMVSQNRIRVSQLADVAGSLMLFAYGVAFAVAGLALSYFTNYATVGHAASMTKHWEHPYVRPNEPSTGRWARLKGFFHILAVVAGLLSLALFIFGMFDVRDAIVRLANAK